MDPEVTDAQLRRHLERNGLLSQPTNWNVEYSNLGGRGIFASRDIKCDELVFSDAPLVLGPRCYSKYLPMCVKCYKTDCALFPCDRGCGLPVCSDDCQNSPEHVELECAYLRPLQPVRGSADWSLELLQAVVPIRALLLPNECSQVFYSVECHEAAQHGREVDVLKKNVKEPISPDDEEFMRRVCRAMDTGCFETAVVTENLSTSLRALFPVGALMNHQCVPNTRHVVDAKGYLLVYATMPIAKGEEITMTYVDLLWDTTMRRQFLQATKHFFCQCSRCSDPTEFGSFLGALRCANENCNGKILPNTPLNFNSNWTCEKCALVIKGKQIASIRAGITAATEEVLHENPRKILRFIERELNILVPETNYVMMDMMFRIVSIFGRADGLNWQELTEKELNIKSQYCTKLVESLDKLNCSYSTKRGLILYELYCTNNERLKRASREQNHICNLLKNKIEFLQNEQILLNSIQILKCDIVAPKDYREIYLKTIEEE